MILPNLTLNYFIFYLIFYSLLLLSLNYFLKKKKILIHKTFNNPHKRASSNLIILSGGLYFLIIFFVTNILNNFHLFNFTIYGIFFFGIGYFSDSNNILSAKIRLLIMSLVTSILIINSQMIIAKIDIKIIDYFLQFNIISILFFTIALVALINGSNFIDGNNGNCTSYFAIIYFLLLYYSEDLSFFLEDIIIIKNILIALIVFTIFNLLNKNYLGDNGSYLIAFMTGMFSMYLFTKYNIPSLLIVTFYSYPVAEVTFSVLRKIAEKRNPLLPDNQHLHQLVENIIFKNFSPVLKNNLSTFFIFFLNIIFFYILINSNISKVNLVQLISFYFFSYISIYLFIRTIVKRNN